MYSRVFGLYGFRLKSEKYQQGSTNNCLFTHSDAYQPRTRMKMDGRGGARGKRKDGPRGPRCYGKSHKEQNGQTAVSHLFGRDEPRQSLFVDSSHFVVKAAPCWRPDIP